MQTLDTDSLLNGSAGMRGTRNGFTLIELLIVAVLLAIFGAFIMQAVSGSDEEATLSSAQYLVRSIARTIDRERRGGSWPSEIKAEWFRGYKLPSNPYAPNQPNWVFYDNDPNEWHPMQKTSNFRQFWYNTQNGAFRIMVPQQESEAATVALYNLANGSGVSSLSDVGL